MRSREQNVGEGPDARGVTVVRPDRAVREPLVAKGGSIREAADTTFGEPPDRRAGAPSTRRGRLGPAARSATVLP